MGAVAVSDFKLVATSRSYVGSRKMSQYQAISIQPQEVTVTSDKKMTVCNLSRLSKLLPIINKILILQFLRCMLKFEQCIRTSNLDARFILACISYTGMCHYRIFFSLSLSLSLFAKH